MTTAAKRKITRFTSRLWRDHKIKAATVPPQDPDFEDGRVYLIDYTDVYVTFCPVSGRIGALVEPDEDNGDGELHTEITRINDIYVAIGVVAG